MSSCQGQGPARFDSPTGAKGGGTWVYHPAQVWDTSERMGMGLTDLAIEHGGTGAGHS